MNTQTTAQMPLYKHNDSCCIFLGTDNGKDLYFGKDNDLKGDVNLIVRCSNNQWDYFTMPSKSAKRLIDSNGLTKNSPLIACYNRYLEYLRK